MSKIIDWFYDKFGNIIIPKTATKAVYDENGNTLDRVLSDMDSSIEENSNQIGILNSNMIDKTTYSKLLKISFFDVDVVSDANACAPIEDSRANPYNVLNIKSLTTDVLVQQMKGWGGNYVGVKMTDYQGNTMPTTTIRVRVYTVDY